MNTSKLGMLFAFLALFCIATSLRAEPLRLEDAVERALERSPAVAALEMQREAADARADAARSTFLPRVDFQETFMRTDQPVMAFGTRLNQGRIAQVDFMPDLLNDPEAIDNWQAKFTLRQPLYTGGRRVNHRKAVLCERRAANLDLEGGKDEIGFRTIEAYWGLSLALESEKVAAMAVETAEEHLAQIDLLYEEGTVVRSDLLSAKVQLAGLRNGLVKAGGRVRVARRVLSILVGESKEGEWAVTDLCKPPEEVRHELDPQVLLDRAKESRPDYGALKARRRAAAAALKAAKGSMLPALGLEGSYEWNTPRISGDWNGSYLLGVGLEWNLFNGLGDRARVKEATANKRVLDRRLEVMEEGLSLEIEKAVVAVTTGRESLRVMAEWVDLAEENLRIIRARYLEGLTTVVELERAELALSNARLAWLRAVYDLRLAVARLKLITGELVESLGSLYCAPSESS